MTKQTTRIRGEQFDWVRRFMSHELIRYGALDIHKHIGQKVVNGRMKSLSRDQYEKAKAAIDELLQMAQAAIDSTDDADTVAVVQLPYFKRLPFLVRIDEKTGRKISNRIANGYGLRPGEREQITPLLQALINELKL